MVCMTDNLRIITKGPKGQSAKDIDDAYIQ